MAGFFGFKSYGAACLDSLDRPEKPRVWIKILFDLACLEIAYRVHGEFGFIGGRREKAAEQLRLAADFGYINDGPESFDWWVARRDLGESILRDHKAPVAGLPFKSIFACKPAGLQTPDDS